MSEKFSELTQSHIDFIEKQQIYFVASAAETGFVNVSPKGMDSLRVINQNKVTWLNLSGSGNETAAHVLENDRMTIMFCSFDKTPLILRLYGNAKVFHKEHSHWDSLAGLFPEYLGARQIFEMDIKLVQTSCGFAVPYYDFIDERPTLLKSAEKKGVEGLKSYWKEKNTMSLDGKDTGIKGNFKES